MALTEQQRTFWRQFEAALALARPQLERDDMVPLVLVLSRVQGAHDDGATVGLTVEDLIVFSRPDVAPADITGALLSAARISRSQGHG